MLINFSLARPLKTVTMKSGVRYQAHLMTRAYAKVGLVPPSVGLYAGVHVRSPEAESKTAPKSSTIPLTVIVTLSSVVTKASRVSAKHYCLKFNFKCRTHSKRCDARTWVVVTRCDSQCFEFTNGHVKG